MPRIYLDHCGSIDGRTQQLFDVFSRHNIADGGIIAVTFSTRGKREGRGKAASVQLAAKALTEAAESARLRPRGRCRPQHRGIGRLHRRRAFDLGQTHAASSSQAKAAELLRETADFVAEAMEMDNDGMIAASRRALGARLPTDERIRGSAANLQRKATTTSRR